MSENTTHAVVAGARPNSTMSNSRRSLHDNAVVGVHLAEARLRWIIGASTSARPVPDEEIRAGLSAGMLETSGGPEGFTAVLAALGPLELGEIRVVSSHRLQAEVSGRRTYLLSVRVDDDGLLEDVSLTEPAGPLLNREQIEDRLPELGARVSFAAGEIDAAGEFRLVLGAEPGMVRPTGSAFKLYVLAALAQAVADGDAHWNELLPIRDEWKSLPSGVMQDRPAGAMAPLAEYADLMISLSDNSATDHLLHRLGRDAVERQLKLLGHSVPERNRPFLSTKAFFGFKYAPDADGRDQYVELSYSRRLALVEELERSELPVATGIWPEPRGIDRIEWFSSPLDICRAYAGLVRFDRPEIDHALSLKDEGLNLDSARYPTVWYKGGSEPGVVTLHYLVRTAEGRTLVASLMVSDPHTTLDTAVVCRAGQDIIRSAFELMRDGVVEDEH